MKNAEYRSVNSTSRIGLELSQDQKNRLKYIKHYILFKRRMSEDPRFVLVSR